jgi:hypothetical protein
MDKPNFERQHTKYTRFRIDTSEKIFGALACLAVPFAIIELVYCCWYSIIWANVNKYDENDWQFALLAPQPDGFDEKTASNHTTTSFASFAGKVFVFMLLAFKATLLGVKDPELLPYSTFASFLALLGMTVFRDASPVQPVPKELTASLPSIARFVNRDMYGTNLAMAQVDDDVLDRAYLFNRLFVYNNYVIVAIVLSLMTLSFWGIFTTKARVWANPLQLHGNITALILAAITFSGYLMTLYAKELAAQETLTLIDGFSEEHEAVNIRFVWPFSASKMDPVSVTMMLTFGSIGIGTCKAHLQNFKLAAVASFINVAISYPTMLATYYGYLDAKRQVEGQLVNFNLWNMDECKQYVMDKPDSHNYFVNGQTGEPYDYADGVAEGICQGVHISFIGQSMIFIALHLMIIACAAMVYRNEAVAAAITMRRYESFWDNQEEDKNGAGVLGMSKGGDTLLISHNGLVTINPGLAPVMSTRSNGPNSTRNFLDDDDDVEQPLVSGNGQN